MTEPLRPGMKHVAGKGREHCRGAAEQDREKVEADRAKDQAVAPHVMQSLDHLLPRVRPVVDPRPGNGSDREQAGEADSKQDRARDIRRERRPRVQIAAERWAENGTALPGDRRQSDGARQDFPRHEVWR